MYKEDTGNLILPSYLPDGDCFETKNDPESNTWKFLNAILKSFVLFEEILDEVIVEMNPATTEDLISRWEEEYGLASSCLGIAGTLEERRKNLLIWLDMDGIQTVADFEALVLRFGFTAIVRPAIDLAGFPLPFPWQFFTEKVARFTLFVDLEATLKTILFPFDVSKFPFPFSSGETNFLECVFRRLVPANVNVIFRYIL